MRLSENTKFKKSGIDIKGLMTRKFAKIPILGQPVDRLSENTNSQDRKKEVYFVTLLC